MLPVESPAERRPVPPPPRLTEAAPAARSATHGAAGLTVPGVVVVVTAVSLVGLLLDSFTGGGIGWVFGGFFVVGSAYAATQVRRTDLAWAVVVPPLVFAVLVVGHSLLADPGGLLSKVVAGLNGLLDYGPQLWVGTGAAAAVVAWRRWGDRLRRAPRS